MRGLRLSVTSACNMKCVYCHREGCAPGGELKLDEISGIFKVCRKHDFEIVKLTGGEPFLRADLNGICNLAKDEGMKVSITTNGSIPKKVNADRINVSLPSLDPVKYAYLTGMSPKKTLEGIRKFRKWGNLSKINMVMLRGINENEVWNALEFCTGLGARLQLIELLPLAPLYSNYHIGLEGIEKTCENLAESVETRQMHGRKVYRIGEGEIEIVKYGPSFCNGCNRLRISSDGKIKPCLMKDGTINIRGLDEAGIEKAFNKAMRLREPYWVEKAYDRYQ